MGLIINYHVYQETEKQLMAYKSGGNTRQTDFILCRTRRKNLKEIENCKDILGVAVAPQHRLIVADAWFITAKKKDIKIMTPKIKWSKLSDPFLIG